VGIFFDRVSKLPRIINVVDFNLTKAKDAKDLKGKSENEVLLRTSCMISTYRFIEKKSEGKKSETKSSPKETADEGTPKIEKK
jgi:Tfp pilus assembly protein PilO